MRKKGEFHLIVSIWLWFCLIVTAIFFVVDMINGYFISSTSVVDRLTVGITSLTLAYSVYGYINIIFYHEEKGIGQAFYYPIFIGFLLCLAVLIFGGIDMLKSSCLFLVTIIILFFSIITNYMLKIKKDGICGWDILY